MKAFAAIAGVLLVVAHGAGFMWIAGKSGGDELAVDTSSVTDWPAGPGLVRKHWSHSYRGGYTRDVAATKLVGPFLDPATPSCTGRIVLGQRLLDDGSGGTHTIAGLMQREIDAQLRGMDIFPVGKYRRIKGLSLEWARLESNPTDRRLLGKAGAPDGYVRATARVVFERVEVPITVALVPQRDAKALAFRIAAEADLDFDNRVLQWVSDKLGADAIASKIAREQIDDVLVTTFAPPPPFELPGGQKLRFTYCDGPVEIVDNAYGALPFAVAFDRMPNAPDILPPKFALASRPSPRPDTTLALDLDLDALNTLLYELWRTGWLDDRLAEVGLDRRFNTEPIVTDYLSIRISPVRLALPPVLSPGSASSLRLAADARVTIQDGAYDTTGNVFGALDFSFAGPGKSDLPLAVDLGALELSCQRSPNILVPCYGDLVSAVRDRGAEFHGALTEAFAKILADIFVDRRIGATGLPADLVIDRAVPTLSGAGTLHLDLTAKLVPPH
ncbi:MAG: hypothetical protein HOV81_20810 [Kofleriaceae bacterium]|nr:hypothetical protein [Kofleriaceae bacterium]